MLRVFSRSNDTIFYLLGTAILLLGIVLTSRYTVTYDLTRESRNSLNARSQSVVSQLQEPATINLYAGNNPALVQSTKDLVSRYQLANDNIRFEYNNIELDPSLSRNKNIESDGEIIIALGDREKRINVLSENSITDALSTLLINDERRLVFLSGHGERRAIGKANHDLGEFSARLTNIGYRIDTLSDDARLPAASANTTLVVASPEQRFSAQEQLALAEYLNNGGNLLWLQDATGLEASKTLSRLLPLTVLPGVIVDNEAQKIGLPSPDFALGRSYPEHASMLHISGTSLYPRAVALQPLASDKWNAVPLLQSSDKSWNETSTIAGNINPSEPNERVGPLPFAFALERSDSSSAQRVVVIGDGDFLANNWLGNGANVAVGEQLMNWLTQTDNAPLVPQIAALDRHVEIPKNSLIALAASLLGIIPLMLFGVAGWQWRRCAA